MKVKELITELKKFDPELLVGLIENEAGEYEADSVKLGLISEDNTIYFRNAKAQQPIVEIT